MTFLRKVYNPQDELIRNYRINLKDRIPQFKSHHVRRYIMACFDQAVAFTSTYKTASHDISPLIGFYAMLNIAKVHVLVKRQSVNLNMSEVNGKFRSHGASSDGIEKLKLYSKGTFAELFHLYYQEFSFPESITLNWLYRNLVDLHDIYFLVYKRKSNYIRTGFAKDLLLGRHLDADPPAQLGLRFDTEEEDRVRALLSENQWTFQRHDDQLCAFMAVEPESKHRSYFSRLKFSFDNDIFLSSQNTPNEIVILYLLFLKLSSLVRYNPKNWNEKLNSKEFSVIDKIMETGLLKFWTLLYTDLKELEHYII